MCATPFASMRGTYLLIKVSNILQNNAVLDSDDLGSNTGSAPP